MIVRLPFEQLLVNLVGPLDVALPFQDQAQVALGLAEAWPEL